jgi:hypothetical protein
MIPMFMGYQQRINVTGTDPCALEAKLGFTQGKTAINQQGS